MGLRTPGCCLFHLFTSIFLHHSNFLISVIAVLCQPVINGPTETITVAMARLCVRVRVRVRVRVVLCVCVCVCVCVCIKEENAWSLSSNNR